MAAMSPDAKILVDAINDYVTAKKDAWLEATRTSAHGSRVARNASDVFDHALDMQTDVLRAAAEKGVLA